MLGMSALPFAALSFPALAAEDDDGWDKVATQYDVTRDVIQLEHGNWGMMARPVLAEYHRQIDRVNRDTSYYARRTMAPDLRAVQARIAAALGVGADELVLTRNATEALKALITGYSRLKPGDAILYADLDYDSMQGCMETVAARRGVTLVKIALPEPASHDAVLAAYAQAFAAHPGLKLVLLTHLSHRTGLIIPVAEIVATARARGIDCIVDAAHSFGQIDFTLPDLGADFIGVNLHKWVGAPLGVGAMVIRRGRVRDIDPDSAERADKPDDIFTRMHTGTVDYAAQLTVPAALDFQAAIGAAARASRLRALRDRWVRPLRDVPGIQILTPDDPRCYGAITSFRLTGHVSREANDADARTLLERYGIFTVRRDALNSGSCIRVTPCLATRMTDMDALSAALRAMARA